MFHRDASKSQLPGGGSSSFFREGFKVNQPTKDGLFPHSHWASEKLFGRCSTNLFNQEKHSPKHTNRKTKRDTPFGGSHTHMHIDVYHVALGHTHTTMYLIYIYCIAWLLASGFKEEMCFPYKSGVILFPSRLFAR